jgi:HAD superfamily phosphoserine phosphatase-like hydrolase
MSVFDLDRTLVTGNSSFAFCQYLISRGALPKRSLACAAWCFLKYTYFGMTLSSLHHTIFNSLLRGRPLDLLESHVDPFVEQYLARFLNARTVAALRLAQHLGDYTVILSNGPQFLVKGFARAFRVNEWSSTQYAVDEQNRLLKIESLLLGQDKASCTYQAMHRLRLDREHVTAYSDSHLDLPLLLAAGTPIVVSPDRKLRKIAQLKSWRQM